MKYEKQTEVDLNKIPKYGTYKIEYILGKDEARKHFKTKDGAFECLFKGSVFCTFKNGEIYSYQFSI